MDLPIDQVDELRFLFEGSAQVSEAGVTYFLIPRLEMPSGCVPQFADSLLCPGPRDGYPSRLFVAEQVQPCRAGLTTARIIERNWFAPSWRIRDGQRLAQMVRSHLDAFRR